MSTIYVERGRIIEARSNTVLCLWENWDIFDAVLGHKYNVKCMEKGIFTGKFFGIKYRLEHVNSDTKPTGGEVKYLASVTSFFCKATTLASLKYNLGIDGNTSVFGKFEAQINGLFSNFIFAKLFTLLAKKLADDFIQDGEDACLFIEKNLDEAASKLTENQREILNGYLSSSVDKDVGKQHLSEIHILKYIKESKGEIQAGDLAIYLGIDLKEAKEKLRIFTENGDCNFNETDNTYIFPDFHKEVEDIPEKSADRLEHRLNLLEDWIKIKLVASHQIIDADPEMAVVRAGKTAEAIVKDIYCKHHDDGESNFSTMIRKLSTDGLIPEHITSWMHTIRSLRNVAVHGDGIDKTQALDALNAALNVAEWHMEQLKSGK